MNCSLLLSLHVLAFFIFHSQVFGFTSSSPTPIVAPLCRPEERSALLQFKASFGFSSSGCGNTYAKTASWNESTNCCQWDGIKCDAATRRVVELDLKCSGLKGIISSNSSLFSLRHLEILRLSGNDLGGSSVLPEFGHFKKMTELDLSGSNFSGNVPLEIAHLSKLSIFSIMNNLYDEKISIGAATFRAMALNFTDLTELSLINVDMSDINPLSSMANLSSSLTSLTMMYCVLQGELPEAFFGFPKLDFLFLTGNYLRGHITWSSLSISHLSLLDLSNNNFTGQIPEIYGNSSQNSSVFSTSLSYLSLQNNLFEGIIPSWIGKQPSLTLLDLSYNHFSGKLYHEFSSPSLRYLSMAQNKLQGHIPSSIFQNVKLNSLDLSSNSFSGNLEIENISNFKHLSYLSLSSNNFSLTFKSSKNFSLDDIRTLSFRSCNIKELPYFLKLSKRLDSLDLSQNKIQGSVPKWFMEVGKDSLSYLNLSHNFLTHLESLSWNSLQTLDLRSNLFSIPLPNLSSKPRLSFVFLSKNHFVGDIPVTFCNMSSLELLDLSHNNLSGTIPLCITNSSSSLSVLDLRMNDLHGSVPSAFAKGSSLRTLNLNGNRLEGSLHQSLLNCKMLEVLDIGGNNISGSFPQWLEPLPELQVLILRGNKFYGPIGSPTMRFSFQKLRIMDLSNNEFTGPLPKKYFEILLAMMDSHTDVLEYMGNGYYHDSVKVVMKGFELQLERIITIFTTIDLSSNNFEGDIPTSIGKLKSLKGLNFSHNKLVGLIPISLGNLSNMEWLDLSSNRLTGEIPNKLAEDLTQLSFLNISLNNLVGPIPRGKQFNTFENDSYIGNMGLCGPPLSKTCSKNAPRPFPTSQKHEERGLDWKIVMLMGYGGGLVFGVSMGYVIIPETTVYRILEIVHWRNQRSSKKLNGRKVRSVHRRRN